MTADRWAICPMCANLIKALLKEVESKPLEGYGAVLREDHMGWFKRLLSTTRIKKTMREDFEAWMDGNGVLHVRYSARCEECGFKYEFVYDEPTPASFDEGDSTHSKTEKEQLVATQDALRKLCDYLFETSDTGEYEAGLLQDFNIEQMLPTINAVLS